MAVATPDGCTETKGGIVGHRQRLGLVENPNHCSHRSEEFLVISWHAGRNASQNSRRVVVAGLRQRLPSKDEFRSCSQGFLDLGVQLLPQITPGHGTDLCRL